MSKVSFRCSGVQETALTEPMGSFSRGLYSSEMELSPDSAIKLGGSSPPLSM